IAAAQGIVTTVAGADYVFPDAGQPALQAHLVQPQGLIFDESTGELYISDFGLNMVLCIESNGIVQIVAGTGLRTVSGNGGPARAASLAAPAAITGGKGIIYFSDYYGGQVRRIDDTKGTISNATPGLSQFSPFVGVAVDRSGNLYIA